MTVRRDRAGDAVRNANAIRLATAAEILEGRLAAGVSQAVAARSVGISHSQFGRIERGELRAITIEQLSRATAAVGLKLVVRAYPDGEPIRDAAQLALLERMRSRLPAGTRWLTEVPMPIEGDRRAWDAVIHLSDGAVAVEAETRLRDIQALLRRIGLKQRDSGMDRTILLINRTLANQQVVAAQLPVLRGSFPLAGRDVLTAIRAGRRPTASGLLLL